MPYQRMSEKEGNVYYECLHLSLSNIIGMSRHSPHNNTNKALRVRERKFGADQASLSSAIVIHPEELSRCQCRKGEDLRYEVKDDCAGASQDGWSFRSEASTKNKRIVGWVSIMVEERA